MKPRWARRRRVLGLGLGLGLGGALPLAGLGARAAPARRMEVLLRKFEFVPRELHARAGEAVVFALGSVDFVHGFAIPELGLRADVAPGRTVEMEVRLSRAGRFTVLCDNFCGEGHDKMTGWLVVADG